ncbi:hypothetical protein LINPERPRIM_LOCUS15237 [Linum perenne]
MRFNGRAAHYAGGEVVEVTFDADFLCYFQLIKIGTEDLQYDSVDRIWYVAPGKTLSNGLFQVLSDADALKLCEAGKKGVVEVYLDTSAVESGYGDNEELESEWHNGVSGSDPEAEVSAVATNVGVVHLLDDSDRTTDPEFLEAMENLGVARFRRRVRQVLSENGEEVEQLTEANRRHQPPRAREEIAVEPNVMVELESMAGNDGRVHSASDGDDEGYSEDSSEDSDFEAPSEDVPSEEFSPDAVNTEDEIMSPVSSYRNSSESDHDVNDKVDEEGNDDLLAGQPWYDPSCDHRKLELKPKLRFTCPTQFKEAVQTYSVTMGANIKWPRSSQQNKEAVCAQQGYRWRVYASWFGQDEAFVIKSVGEPHTCPRPITNRSASSKWIARRFLSRFKIDPEYNTKHLAREMYETYGVQVTSRVCVLAKIEAKRLLEGSLNDAYAKLRSYVLQLMKSDPEGRFVLKVDPVIGEEYVTFKRLYIGFSCLRKGFLKGCRKIFAVDGCFLKGEVKGMILTAVGKDGNNQMFPIAWAVVEGENRDSWGWFMNIIQEELNLGDGTGWSIISDQQKVVNFLYYFVCQYNCPSINGLLMSRGLVETLKTVLPVAEHRKCARHVAANWKIKHKASASRAQFWAAVYSSNEHEYNLHLTELQRLDESGVDPNCYVDFLAQDPTTFCRLLCLGCLSVTPLNQISVRPLTDVSLSGGV